MTCSPGSWEYLVRRVRIRVAKRKSRHRIPLREMHSDPIDDRYQTEVDYSTNRLQRRYERMIKARDAAQHRLAVAIERNRQASQLAELRRQLELREYELIEIVKLMQPNTRSNVPWRPIPITHSQPI